MKFFAANYTANSAIPLDVSNAAHPPPSPLPILVFGVRWAAAAVLNLSLSLPLLSLTKLIFSLL